MKMKKWLKCLLMMMVLMTAVNVGTVSTTIPAAAKAKTSSFKKGTEFWSGKLQYKVTSLKGKTGTAALVGAKSSVTSVNVPKTVTKTVKKVKYTLTVDAIGKGAFQDCTKLKKVVTNTAIKKIEANAFAGCKKLKTVDIKSKVLKTVDKNALKGVSKKTVVTVPDGKTAAYVRLLKVDVRSESEDTAAEAPAAQESAQEAPAAALAAETAEPAPETEAAPAAENAAAEAPAAVTASDTAPARENVPAASTPVTSAPSVETAPAPTPAVQKTPASAPSVETAPAPTPAVQKAPASAPAAQKTTASAPSVKETEAPAPAVQKTPTSASAAQKTPTSAPAAQKTTASAPSVKETEAPQTSAPAVQETEAKCGKKHLGLVVVESVAPTCTETGLSSYEYCTVCGYRTTPLVLSALGHELVRHAAVAPTCTSTGLTAYDTCTRCGYATTPDTVAKTPHRMVSVEGKQPTCTSWGWEPYEYCQDCGYQPYYRSLSPLGHNHVSWSVVKDATCTEEGIEESRCTRCGLSKTRTFAAAGHKYGEKHVEPVPGNNCYNYVVYYCTVCNYRNVTGGVEHRADVMVPQDNIEPTCTTSGKRNRSICPYCQMELFSYVKPLGHNFCTGTTVEEATCSSTGLSYRKCIRCDEKTAVKTLPKTAHTWKDVSTEATCTEDGFQGKVCEVCGERQGTVTKAAGHSYTTFETVEPSCGVQGSRKERCSVCGDVRETVLPALAEHKWVSHAQKQATCTEDGCTAYAQCSRCGAYKDGIEPKTIDSLGGHSWAPASASSLVGIALEDEKCEMTEFVRCTRCGTYKVIPRRGHVPGNSACGYEIAKANGKESGYIQWTVFLSEKNWSQVPAGFESKWYHTLVWMDGKMYHAYIPTRRSDVSFAAPVPEGAGFAGWKQVIATGEDSVQFTGSLYNGTGVVFGPEHAGKTFVAVYE